MVWLDDATLWRSVLDTLDRLAPPGAEGPIPSPTMRSLRGLALYALHRPPDRGPARVDHLARLVGCDQAIDPSTLHALVSAELVAAEEGEPSERADALRRALLAHLDEDVADVAPLLEHFGGHALPAGGTGPGMTSTEVERFRHWLEHSLGQPVDTVETRPVSGGYSRRMIEVVATGSHGRTALMVRVEQGGVFGSDGQREVSMLQALRPTEVPVPSVRGIEPTGTVLGQPFFAMDLVEGGEEDRPGALADLLRCLALLHRLPQSVAESAFGPTPASPEAAVLGQLDYWQDVYRRCVPDPIPLLDEVRAWLDRHLWPTGPTVLVHGDAGPGNFLWREGRLRALIDWELGHVGDACEDWSYLVYYRGRKLHDPGTWRSILADVCGVAYDPPTWHAWRVFNAYKGACANLTALRVFVDGTTPRPELLAVGTAVHLRFVNDAIQLIDAGPEVADPRRPR